MLYNKYKFARPLWTERVHRGFFLILQGMVEMVKNRYDKEVLYMGCLGNLLWFVCGGFFSGLGWLIAGLFWCITIVGIPWGTQCFKFASLSFFPFGKEVEYGGGVGSLLLNVIWLILSGIPMAVGSAIMGCILCVTIIGIPFGLQHFKIAKLALMPFGARIC